MVNITSEYRKQLGIVDMSIHLKIKNFLIRHEFYFIVKVLFFFWDFYIDFKCLLFFNNIGLIKKKYALRYKKFIEDSLVRIGIIQHPHKVIFVAGLPKSGTTWMENILISIQGYAPRRLICEDSILQAHGISDSVFYNFPRSLYTVIKTHLHPCPRYIDVLDRWRIDKILLMWRDPRDHIVSAYYHVKIDKFHPDFELFNRISLDKAIHRRIELFINEYYEWIMLWKKELSNNPKRYLLVKYEDLHDNTINEFKRVLSFYGINIPSHEVNRIIKNNSNKAKKEKNPLKKRIEQTRSMGAGMKSTFRSGKIGDWKDHFSDRNKIYFKEHCGQLLISLGYEKNTNW